MGKRYRQVPKETIESTWDWFNANSLQSNYKNFNARNLDNLKAPIGLGNDIHEPFKSPEKNNLSPVFAAIIPDGRIIGKQGTIVTPNHKILWDVSMEYDRTSKNPSLYDLKKLPPLEETDETVADLTFSAFTNYYHWMFDVISRLYLINKLNISIDKFVFNPILMPFQKEMLDLLEIPKSKIIFANESLHLKAKNLVVTSWIGYDKYMPQWACEYLKSIFFKEIKDAAIDENYKKIYISRELTFKRKVTNEEEVLQVLDKYGFKKVLLENLSFKEQINIFKQAEMIVAPHGAGLTNLLFANPDTKVLEIYSPSYVNVCFWVLSNHMNFQYYYLIGNQVDGKQSDLGITDNITVDLLSLNKMLGVMGV